MSFIFNSCCLNNHLNISLGSSICTLSKIADTMYANRKVSLPVNKYQTISAFEVGYLSLRGQAISASEVRLSQAPRSGYLNILGQLSQPPRLGYLNILGQSPIGWIHLRAEDSDNKPVKPKLSLLESSTVLLPLSSSHFHGKATTVKPARCCCYIYLL